MPANPAEDPIWPDAPSSVLAAWNIRRAPLRVAPDEIFPPEAPDLPALARQIVPADEPALPPRASAHARKRHELRRELAGMSELAALNSLLIAHLRKRRAPSGARKLFLRIWTEMGPQLLAELPPRWLISSVITFADHGWNEEQRRVGLAMQVLLSLLKLYEHERVGSGLPGHQPFSGRRASEGRLPLDMPAFALMQGGLDVALIAPIWEMAAAEPVAGPIACHLLDALNHDPAGLFRRMELMRRQRRGDTAEG